MSFDPSSNDPEWGVSWTLQRDMCCRNTGLVPSSLDTSCKSSLPSSCLWVITVSVSCLGRRTVRTAQKMVFSPWNRSSLFLVFLYQCCPHLSKLRATSPDGQGQWRGWSVQLKDTPPHKLPGRRTGAQTSLRPENAACTSCLMTMSSSLRM